MDVSSTRLRELLARGEGWEYLSPAVYGYILRHGLYGAGRDLKRLPDRELRACSYSMIRAKRVPHVMGVEEEAVRLAKFWGADPELARHAGILHDCTKYLELEPQLELCRKYGIELDSWSRRRSSSSTPRRGHVLPSMFLENLRRCIRPSSGTPPERRICLCWIRSCIWPTT